MPRVCVDTHTHTHTHTRTHPPPTVNAQWSSALWFICSEEGGRWTLVSQGKQLEQFPAGIMGACPRCSEGCFCVRRVEPPQPRGKETKGSRESAVDSSLGLNLALPAPLCAGPSASPRWHDASLIPSMPCGFPGLSVLWLQSLWRVFKGLRTEGRTDFSELVVLFSEAGDSPWSGPRWRRVGSDLLVVWSLWGAHGQGLWEEGTIAWGPDALTSLCQTV